MIEEILAQALEKGLPLLADFIGTQVANGKVKAEIHQAALLVSEWFCAYRCNGSTPQAMIDTADAVADAAEDAKFPKP